MEIRNELNEQTSLSLLEGIRQEENARIMYRNLANYARCYGYIGAHKYFGQEAIDEAEHSHMIQHYIDNRGVEYEVPLPDKTKRPENLRDCFKIAYKAESNLYEFYQNLSISVSHEDKETHLFVNKLIEIQYQSMSDYKIFLRQLENISDDDLYFWQSDVFGELVKNPTIPNL